MWHGNLHKRKASSGRKRRYRKKRNNESGSFPTQTILGKTKKKVSYRRGSKIKSRLFSVNNVNVSILSTGKTEKVEILRVTANPANLDYNRRGVITKGAVIETSLGKARVTSRPGQDGIVNAVLTSEQD